MEFTVIKHTDWVPVSSRKLAAANRKIANGEFAVVATQEGYSEKYLTEFSRRIAGQS